MYLCREKLKNNGPLIAILAESTVPVKKCLWLQIARVEMEFNLKSLG